MKIIAVASGKGGVGKSTTSVNLALAIASSDASVGLLDADIYGPNQPHMLGTSARPEIVDGKKLQPIEVHGIKSMSIGYLVDPATPTIWRGPMVSSALKQLYFDTQWGELDYLLIDLPPGTGDVQLTLSQKIPVAGAVIVTTPQDISLLDVRKAVGMFEKVQVPILGVVENMSTHVCSNCGHQDPVFGTEGAAKLADEYGLTLLGQLPLARQIREDADRGQPTVVASPESEHAKSYQEIAARVIEGLNNLPKQTTFPKIVVE